MKYTLIALSALALWTGAASAAQNNWHCNELKANWQHAPQLQCPQGYLETRVQRQGSLPAPPAPPRVIEVEVVDEIPE